MKASNFSDAQKAFIIKQGEDGTPVAEICRKAGISQATYFNWKKKYAGLLPTEMKRLKQLEDENARLKKIVADLTLDREMLQDVIRRKLRSLVGCANWFAGCAAIGRCRSGRLVGPSGLTVRRSTTNPAAPIRLPWPSGSGRSVRPVSGMVTDAFMSCWTVKAGGSTSRKSIAFTESWGCS